MLNWHKPTNLERTAARYALSVVAVCLAALLRWALDRYLGTSSPFITFYLAIMLAAIVGDVGPTLVATALGAVAGLWLFVEPRWRLGVGDTASVVRLLLYLATGLGSAVLSGWLHATRRRFIQQLEEANRSNRERRVSEARYRSLVEASAQAVWVAEPTGEITEDSPSWRAFTGQSYEQFRGWGWVDALHPMDRRLAAEAWQKSVKSRCPYQAEYRIRNAAGEYRHMSVRAVPVLNDDGGIREWVGMNTDLTEQRRAEEAKAMLAAIVESSANAVIGESPDGTILSWNAGAERLFGYTAEEAVGRPISMLAPETQIESQPEQLEELRRGQTIRRQDVERVRKDGSRIIVSLSVSPIKDAAGRMIGISKIAHDVTDLRRAQEELKVAVRSAEAAKAMAEQASQAKDHFLAVLSHELRTPLTPVLTTAELLERDSELPARYREDIEMIRRNVELEARLIDDLLDVTRIARGKIELHLQLVPLCEVIRRAVDVCRPDIEARHLEFGLDIGPDAPYVINADPGRLQQVFWNLIKNAIKFTPQGGCVGVRCRREKDSVIAEVVDSGEGIDPAILPHIFQPFEQGGVGVTRQFGGLGLGLTISKGLIEKHGGSIQTFSEGKGKGSTFRVMLPLLKGAELHAPSHRPESESAIRAPGSAPGHPLRILLVEDHGDTARIMQRLLGMEGHRVEIAGDMTAALQMAASGDFDLVISDLGLPDGNGVDLLRTLRERGLRMPAIALSGYGQEQDIERTREVGFSAHLTKPTSPEKLTEAIAAATG